MVRRVLLMGLILAAFSANAGRITMSNPEPYVSIPTVFTPLPTSRSRNIARIAKVSTRSKVNKLWIRVRRTLKMKVIAQKDDCGEPIGDQ